MTDIAKRAYQLAWGALVLAAISLGACLYLSTGLTPDQLATHAWPAELTHALGGMASGLAWATIAWIWPAEYRRGPGKGS